MPNKFQFKLQLCAALIGLVISVQASAAKAFTQADNAQLISLSKKLQAAAEDIHATFEDMHDTSNSRFPGFCLADIFSTTESLVPYLMFARGQGTLATQMHDKRDEHLLLADMNGTLTAAVHLLPDLRQNINKVMGTCSQSAIVNVKGQAILDIVSEIEQEVSRVQKVLDKVEKTLP